MRGVAAQSMLVAFQLFAANIRTMNELLTRKAAGEKKLRKLPSRRMTRSLTTWAPASKAAVSGTADGASADPDPPLTACDRRSPAEVTAPAISSRPGPVLGECGQAIGASDAGCVGPDFPARG